MKTLKYTVIKNKDQYKSYCDKLEELILHDKEETYEEIELINVLIDKWDEEHNTFMDSDPIEIIKALMTEHQLKAKDMVEILGLSKGTISKILNYHKGLSKDTIRKLSDYFKISQEAFNRPYKLVNPINRKYRNANLINTKKNIIEA